MLTQQVIAALALVRGAVAVAKFSEIGSTPETPIGSSCIGGPMQEGHRSEPDEDWRTLSC